MSEFNQRIVILALLILGIAGYFFLDRQLQGTSATAVIAALSAMYQNNNSKNEP